MQETGCAGTCLCGRLQQPRRYLQLGEEGDISYLVGIILCQGWEGFWKWPSHDADKLTKVGDLPKAVQLASGHTQNQSPELRFQTLMCPKIFQAACLKEREGKKQAPQKFSFSGSRAAPRNLHVQYPCTHTSPSDSDAGKSQGDAAESLTVF